MALVRQGVTLEEFRRLPEQEPALEYEEGRILQKVAPKGRHSRLQYRIAECINRFTEPRTLALAFPEVRVTFGGRSYVPDVAVYLWDRIPTETTGQIADEFANPPDIAVEIASPEQSVNALVRRCIWYVANGVRVALLVDPADESVLVFRPDQTPRALRGAETLELHDVLPGFALTVQELFDSLRVR
jgi:Uma2 family endonuclease